MCPCIETPLHAADVTQGMLLQSGETPHAGEAGSPSPVGEALVDVFPAMPSNWTHASFHRLRADGAFEVSGVWRDGRTRWVAVRSLAGTPLALRPRLGGAGMPAGEPAHVTLTPDADRAGVFRVQGLGRGETLLLWADGEDRDTTVVSPVAGDASQYHFFGKRGAPAALNDT